MEIKYSIEIVPIPSAPNHPFLAFPLSYSIQFQLRRANGLLCALLINRVALCCRDALSGIPLPHLSACDILFASGFHHYLVEVWIRNLNFFLVETLFNGFQQIAFQYKRVSCGARPSPCP